MSRTSLSNRLLIGLLRAARVRAWQFDPDRFAGPPRASARPPRPPRGLRGVVVEEAGFEGWRTFRLTPSSHPDAGRRTLVYVHGGAWAAEIQSGHWRLAAELAGATGREVLLPLYPLVPRATRDDVVPVVARLVARLAEERPVALAGDSAGATIALLAAQELVRSGRPVPERIVLLSPALDLAFTDPGIAEIAPRDPLLRADHIRELAALWAGDRSTDDPFVSPLRGPLDGLGELHVFAGTRDILHPDAATFAGRGASADGTTIALHVGDGMVHDWMLLPTPEGRTTRREIARRLA